MSDLFDARQKVEEGAQWRGTIDVSIDGEQTELTVRQLRDVEFWDVMSQVDTDEIDALQNDMPEDLMDEFQALQNKDSLTDEESERLQELQERAEEEINMFEELSLDTYKGIVQAAKYGVEPDENDVRTAIQMETEEIQEFAGTSGGVSNEQAREYINERVIEPMIEESTEFTSFAIGVKVLGETLGDTGNSES